MIEMLNGHLMENIFHLSATGQAKTKSISRTRTVLEEAIQLTFNSDTYKYNPIWSPDSKYLLWGDKMARLNLMEIATKKVKVIYEAE